MLTIDYDRLGLAAGDRLLDLGCGFGRHAYETLRRGADVVACDLGLDELRGVRNVVAAMYEAGEISDAVQVGAANGDATRLPFDDCSFDHVIASEVLEHIDDDEAALAELTRVLRPGGTLAVMGLIAGIDPDMAAAITAGMHAYLNALPEPLYALFGTGYLGYTAARVWGKAKGRER